MDVMQAEQFGALAANWSEAQEIEDSAAAEAFEDELHERIAFEEIGTIEGLDSKTGEPSPAETERVRAVLQKMWNNASARLD